MESSKWYVSKNGQTLGPYSAEQVTELVLTGRFSGEDLIICEGQNEWLPIGRSPDFQPHVQNVDEEKTNLSFIAPPPPRKELESGKWYFLVKTISPEGAVELKTLGPYDLSQARDCVSLGKVKVTDLCCGPNYFKWKTLGVVRELAAPMGIRVVNQEQSSSSVQQKFEIQKDSSPSVLPKLITQVEPAPSSCPLIKKERLPAAAKSVAQKIQSVNLPLLPVPALAQELPPAPKSFKKAQRLYFGYAIAILVLVLGGFQFIDGEHLNLDRREPSAASPVDFTDSRSLVSTSKKWDIVLTGETRDQVKVQIASVTGNILDKVAYNLRLHTYAKGNKIELDAQALGLPQGYYHVRVFDQEKIIHNSEKGYVKTPEGFQSQLKSYQSLIEPTLAKERAKLLSASRLLLEASRMEAGAILKIQQAQRVYKNELALLESEVPYFFEWQWLVSIGDSLSMSIQAHQSGRSPASIENVQKIQMELKKFQDQFAKRSI